MKFFIGICLIICCFVPTVVCAESLSYNGDELERFRTSPLLKQVVYRVESSIQTFFMAHKDMVLASQCRLPPEKYELKKIFDPSSFIRVTVQLVAFDEGTLVISLASSMKAGMAQSCVENMFQAYIDGINPNDINLNSTEGKKISEGILFFLFGELKNNLENTMPFVDPKKEFPESLMQTYGKCQQGISLRLAKFLPKEEAPQGAVKSPDSSSQ
jgi:hypothetical protein